MKKFLLFFLSILLTACTHTPSVQELSSEKPAKSIVEESSVNASEVQNIDNNPEEPPYPVSLPALMEKEFTGSNLKLEQVLVKNNSYTRYRISYLANELTISGIMNIPVGKGPFPLLILNHGYIDPEIYTNGRGLKREQDYFAKQGFSVLHPDYRNHAFSDKDESTNTNFRLGYTEDVIGAILAVQNSELPELQVVDSKNVGMLGHSMGGGITQNILVVKPNLIKAAVLYAPVSSDARENLEQYFLKRPNRQDRVKEIYEAHGSPQENPEFWDNISPHFFFDRVEVPVQIHIGIKDDSTPPEWSQDIANQLKSLGKDVDLNVYEGEKHEFIPKWKTFMERSAEFFKRELL